MICNLLNINDLQATTPWRRNSGSQAARRRGWSVTTVMLGLVSAAVLGGCNDQTKIKHHKPGESGPGIVTSMDPDDPANDRGRAEGLADLDFGEDWADAVDQRPAGTTGATASGSGDASPDSGEFWAIVLGTFSGESHAGAASNMLGQLGGIDTSLPGKSRVHTKEVGSYVIYGRYGSPQSPEARAELTRIRNIKVNGNPVFPRAMFTRIQVPVDPARLHAHDLRQVRLAHPNIHPLYSLEVAVWVAENDSERDLEQAQRKAQAEVTRLRAQGFEAYFYHDSTKRVSSITIGRFDHTDWDAQANLESSRVIQIRRSFPIRLMNGEQVDEVLIANEVTGEPIKTIPMVPRLVLVPDIN